MNPKCPTCRAEVTVKEPGIWPFCSERCKMIDLGQWAAEKYRVPGAPVPEGMTAEELEAALGEQGQNGSGSHHKKN